VALSVLWQIDEKFDEKGESPVQGGEKADLPRSEEKKTAPIKRPTSNQGNRPSNMRP